jgi:3-deoxy-D-manno-octulosonic-acid transferase
MFIIYDLVFLIFALFYLPIYFFKKKFHPGFQARFGILPPDLKLDRPIWIHAVSVGEVMAIRRLVDELRVCLPHKQFVITTVTPTGNKIAKAIAKEKDFVSYLPLDISLIVKKFVYAIRPSVVIIAETEIWPNFIYCLYSQNIPVIIVNGRISDNSFKGYLCIRPLVKPLFNKVSLFCVQAERDATRLEKLGLLRDKIRITGNMKFDMKEYAELKESGSGLRQRLGLAINEKLLIAASTHQGEENIILNVYKDMKKDFPDLRLLIAPRHPERANKILELVKNYHFKPQRICPSDSMESNSETIYILDTVGELLSYYAISDIVFVGGSLMKIGGHNILEPAFLGKPVLFGPHMFNFRDIAGLFLENKAAICVSNQQELKSNIKQLLENPAQIPELALKAKQLIQKNRGATNRNLKLIMEFIS